MKIFAKIPCSFGGEKFKIGDEIPAELVSNPKAQEKRGVIAIADESELQECTAQVGVVKFAVPIHAEEGDFTPLLTNEELNVFTDILQIGVKTTEDKQKISEMIQNIESEDLLIVLHALDGRKHVVEEAMARAQALTGAEGADGSGGDE